MNGRFHEPLTTGKIRPPSERSTGLVFAAVCVVVAILFRHSLPVLLAAIAAAAALAIASVAAPSLLRPLNRAWFGLSVVLHRVVNPVVMLLIFAVAFVPLGLCVRLWRDPLVRRRRPDLRSYWVSRDPAEPGHSMRNQF